jgi:hypothetical protein
MLWVWESDVLLWHTHVLQCRLVDCTLMWEWMRLKRQIIQLLLLNSLSSSTTQFLMRNPIRRKQGREFFSKHDTMCAIIQNRYRRVKRTCELCSPGVVFMRTVKEIGARLCHQYLFCCCVSDFGFSLQFEDRLCGPDFLATDPEVRIRFPSLPDFLRSSGSGKGSTQPREYN